MRSIVGRLSMLAMAWVLSGCAAPPESMVALSEPGEDYDHRLIGAWNSVHGYGGEAIYLEIRPGDQPEFLDVTGIATFSSAEFAPVYWLTATAFASRVGSQDYYNVQRVAGAGLDYTAEGESPGFIILQATFSDDATLNLCPMYAGKDAATHVPKDRRRVVDGRFGRSNKGPKYTVFELSRDELVAMVRDTPGEELFDCFPPFHKVLITNTKVWIHMN